VQIPHSAPLLFTLWGFFSGQLDLFLLGRAAHWRHTACEGRQTAVSLDGIGCLLCQQAESISIMAVSSRGPVCSMRRIAVTACQLPKPPVSAYSGSHNQVPSIVCAPAARRACSLCAMLGTGRMLLVLLHVLHSTLVCDWECYCGSAGTVASYCSAGAVSYASLRLRNMIASWTPLGYLVTWESLSWSSRQPVSAGQQRQGVSAILYLS
jgi:hypothetical protein